MTLKKNGFTFKRFFVAHDKSPMKITTDSVLLGAWSNIIPQPRRVLDIGTGCGVIALMLAQRLENTSTIIDAIDIDENAIEQCKENINSSPFKQLNAYCDNVTHFAKQTVNRYDLIVTNPPYFDSSVDCRSTQRQQARYTETLTHAMLVKSVNDLLTEDGRFCLVLPYQLADKFIMLCKAQSLHLNHIVNIRNEDVKPYSLSLLQFTKQQQSVKSEELCLRQAGFSYTTEFVTLLKDFYLKF